MPAEAIHLSALEDSIGRAAPGVRDGLKGTDLYSAARVGALFVDFPYFHRLPLAIGRYLLRRPPAPSAWGDIFHNKAPIAVGRNFAQQAFVLRRAEATRGDGEWLWAFALGYISHAAVDRSIHPLVNTLAKVRAARLSDSLIRQHQEVEKFQSILFHEERFGRDFMGTPDLYRHLRLDFSGLFRPVIWSAISRSLTAAVGNAPELSVFRSWTTSYSSYAKILASPLGKRIAPAARKAQERPWSYDEVNFTRTYESAVRTSTHWLDTVFQFQDSGDFSEQALVQFEKYIPEGTIDPAS